MTTLHITLLLVFTFVCFLLISAVLLQTGKGGGMAGLGGGGSDTAFGAHTANVLQKFTGWIVFVFFILVITLSHTLKDGERTDSVIDSFQPVQTNNPAPSAAPSQQPKASAATPVAPIPAPAAPTQSALPTSPVAPQTPEPSQATSAPNVPVTVPDPTPATPKPQQ